MVDHKALLVKFLRWASQGRTPCTVFSMGVARAPIKDISDEELEELYDLALHAEDMGERPIC